MIENDMSFESLYSQGFGLTSVEKNNFSYESFDGFEDAVDIELTHAINSLEFLDTYANINNKLVSDKIKMCKKLSVTYGLKSGVNADAAKSIESLCQSHIMSLEADAAEETDTADAADKPATPNTAKKDGFFKTIWKAIKIVFENIVRFFKKMWEKISGFFKKIFKKADKDIPQEVVKEAVQSITIGTGSDSGSSNNFEASDDQRERIGHIGSVFGVNIIKINNKQEDLTRIMNWCAKASNVNENAKKIEDILTRVVKTFNGGAEKCTQLIDELDRNILESSDFHSSLNSKVDQNKKEEARKGDALVNKKSIAQRLAPMFKKFGKTCAEIGKDIGILNSAYQNNYKIYKFLEKQGKKSLPEDTQNLSAKEIYRLQQSDARAENVSIKDQNKIGNVLADKIKNGGGLAISYGSINSSKIDECARKVSGITSKMDRLVKRYLK